MKRVTLAALGSGGLFGLGLAISGMTDARRVLAFLDVFGSFDPTLGFVLGGALLTTTLLYRFVLRRGGPVWARSFKLPQAKHVDRRLLGGSALFGFGWGLAGYCPGPALASLGLGAVEALWFIPAMLAGSLLHRLSDRG
jgi:uncharacterized membrane protein YedE/YeeE